MLALLKLAYYPQVLSARSVKHVELLQSWLPPVLIHMLHTPYTPYTPITPRRHAFTQLQSETQMILEWFYPL